MGSAKLTEKDVAAIRDEYVRGSSTRGTTALARKFGVSAGHISRVIRGDRNLWT